MVAIRFPLASTSLHLTADELAAVVASIPARATYQRAYAFGRYRVSGADLTGKARRYGASYYRARRTVERAAQTIVGELVTVCGPYGCRSLWFVSALDQEVGA